jgi:hypothetical protein
MKRTDLPTSGEEPVQNIREQTYSTRRQAPFVGKTLVFRGQAFSAAVQLLLILQKPTQSLENETGSHDTELSENQSMQSPNQDAGAEGGEFVLNCRGGHW